MLEIQQLTLIYRGGATEALFKYEKESKLVALEPRYAVLLQLMEARAPAGPYDCLAAPELGVGDPGDKVWWIPYGRVDHVLVENSQEQQPQPAERKKTDPRPAIAALCIGMGIGALLMWQLAPRISHKLASNLA